MKHLCNGMFNSSLENYTFQSGNPKSRPGILAIKLYSESYASNIPMPQAGFCSRLIPSTSCIEFNVIKSSSLKSITFELAFILSGVTDFGIATIPLETTANHQYDRNVEV